MTSKLMYEFVSACEEGNMHDVELMIKNKEVNTIEDWNWGLYGACKGNQTSIIELMVEKGANDWNAGLSGACQGGHISVVQLMIEKGADELHRGIEGACQCGSMSMWEHGPCAIIDRKRSEVLELGS